MKRYVTGYMIKLCEMNGGESELSTRFRVPEKNDWFVENNDSILNEMYQVIGQYFEKRFSDKQICDIELLTRTGPLTDV